MRRVFWILAGTASLSFALSPAPNPTAHLPDSFRYSNQLLPAVVAIAEQISLGGSLEKTPPCYVSVSTGKDEYVYHLKDKIFIRCIKDRYELPSWRICGDFAVVRVELMDESMNTLPPVMAWFMIYRENRWQKLFKDEEGHFLRESFSPAELPPYAVRCFEQSPEREVH